MLKKPPTGIGLRAQEGHMKNETYSRFHGVFTALVTPFNLDGSLDLGALTALLTEQKAAGVHGFVMAGTTGEAPCLSIEERMSLVKLAQKIAAGDIPVIAGAGSNCTQTAIYLQKAMEDAGADATLQVVPYYNKPTQDGLLAHFGAIADRALRPIFLYNAAGRTSIDICPATVAKLAASHEKIIGIKDANSNTERLIDLLSLTHAERADFLVLAGEDSAFLPYLALGAHGIISVSSHLALRQTLELYYAFKKGELAYAQKIASMLNRFNQLLFSATNPIPVKSLLAAKGKINKVFRLPLISLNEHDEAVLLDKYNLLGFMHD